MANHPFQLPKPVEAHFQATNAGDPTAFLSTFSENAVVIDAGKEYREEAAIKQWSDRNYDKTGLPDPLYLDLHFTVEGDKVTRLRTTLSSNGRAIPLPQPVSAFYHACDVYDDALLAGCFAADATG